MYRKVIIIYVGLVLISAILGPVGPVRAAVSGTPPSVVSFPGATATNCGFIQVTGGLFQITAPGIDDEYVTDGAGVLLFHLHNAGGFINGVGGNPANWHNFFDTFGVPPTKNPISLRVVIDGTTFLNVAGDDPCLPPSQGSSCSFNDGRINKDCGEPVAVYCNAHGIDVYWVHPTVGTGSLIIRLTAEDITRLGVPKDHNMILKQYGNVTLWRLTSGLFQVNTFYGREPKKPYIISWDSCPNSVLYHLAW